MKYLILLTALLFLSCDVTEPEVEETINCSQLCVIKDGVLSTGYTMIGIYNVTYNDQIYTSCQCDVIKVVVKGDDLKFYEIYRFGNYSLKEPQQGYKYIWTEK